MKRLLLVLLSVVVLFPANAQTKQIAQQSCHFGISFEISENPCWGYGEPVVIAVEPHSPAALAGVKVGDIIMEINSTATYLRNYETIYNWLFDQSQDEVTFTIRNLNTYFKEYKLSRLCKNIMALSEADLATAFSFYSLEDTRDYSFELPLKVTTNKDADYSDYQTFDFVTHDDAPEIDKQIEAGVEKELINRGLTRNTEDPDLIIQTYYMYQPNDRYDEAGAASILPANKKSKRYDVASKEIISVPILSQQEQNAETKGMYTVQFGIRILDKKHLDPKNLTQIWDCNIKEYLTDKYSLSEYARIYTPLLLMQYPYATDRNSAKYLVSYKKYNYTGLNFSADDMVTVTDVDAGSPAFIAGLRAGDVVTSIDGNNFSYNNEELNDGYKRFIAETMVYRNPETRFINAKGFPDCMFWSKGRFSEVAKTFKKGIYAPKFSYLYNFNKYISEKTPTQIEIEAKSLNTQNKKRVYDVKPVIRASVTVRTY